MGPKVDDTSEIAKADALDIFSGAPVEEAIFEVLDRLGARVRGASALERMLQTFCQQSVATIPSSDMAGIALVPERGTKLQTVACTDARVLDIELDQYRVDEGPGVESARTAQLVRAGREDVGKRWPDFARRVARSALLAISRFRCRSTASTLECSACTASSITLRRDRRRIAASIHRSSGGCGVEGQAGRRMENGDRRPAGGDEIARIHRAGKRNADGRARDRRGPSLRDVGDPIAAAEHSRYRCGCEIIRVFTGQSGT